MHHVIMRKKIQNVVMFIIMACTVVTFASCNSTPKGAWLPDTSSLWGFITGDGEDYWLADTKDELYPEDSYIVWNDEHKIL